MYNRRQFLSGCSSLALAAAFSSNPLCAAPVLGDRSDEQLSFASFSKFVGSAFIVQSGAEPRVTLELIRAVPQPALRAASAKAPDAHHEKFSLMFRGPQSASLAQNTYTFQHRHMGRFAMFIVPVGLKDQEHDYYQAIFNRPLAAPDNRLVPA
jgi:hypothetical protein